MKFRIMIGIISMAIIIATGCSKDKPTSANSLPDTTGTNTTRWDSQGYWVTEINATSSSNSAFYNFARKDTVTITDAQALNDTSWNIAFKRSGIVLNSGVSGIGDVVGVDMAALGNSDSVNFGRINNIGMIGNSDWVSDFYSLVVNNWYSYNPNTHQMSMTHYVYVMKDAQDNYVKFQVISMMNNGQPPNMGTVSIQYIYAGTSPSFTGIAPDTLTFDGSSGGPVYIDFSAGTTTQPADPRNSVDWDILFDSYDIHQNNTVFGSGHSATYEIWRDQTDPTNFLESGSAPTQPQAYFPDQLGSVMTNWYDYDGNTHTLTSKNHVYIIRHGAKHFKLQIRSYYKDISGSPVSGWYMINWLGLD